MLSQVFLGFSDGVLAVVKNRGSERRVGVKVPSSRTRMIVPSAPLGVMRSMRATTRSPCSASFMFAPAT